MAVKDGIIETFHAMSKCIIEITNEIVFRAKKKETFSSVHMEKLKQFDEFFLGSNQSIFTLRD